VNIAGVCKRMGGRESPAKLVQPYRELAEKARLMLRQCLEALMDLNAEGARAVLKSDDDVDDAYHAFVELLNGELDRDPTQGRFIFGWLMAAKSIERVADLATNIAEDTIYTVEGEIVRHGQG
jgi:phosphate transport system protein